MPVVIVADIHRCALRRVLASPAAGLALATLLWSGNFVIGRALREAIDPLELNFWRWLVALVALLPFTGAALVRQWPLLRRHLPLVVALGLTGLAVPHACIYTALRTTTAVNALLLLNLTPLLVALGAWAFFGQAMRRAQCAGLALSMAGAATLIVSGRLEALLALELRPGDLWMLPAIASAAAHVLLLRRTPAGLTQGPLLAASAAAALVLMSPLLMWRGELVLPGDGRVLVGLAYIGILASALAFWLWNRGVAALGPVRSAGYMFLMPVYAALLSFMLLGEAVQASQLAGGALVLFGLRLAQPRAKRLHERAGAG